MYYKENSCKSESESIDSSPVWKNMFRWKPNVSKPPESEKNPEL